MPGRVGGVDVTSADQFTQAGMVERRVEVARDDADLAVRRGPGDLTDIVRPGLDVRAERGPWVHRRQAYGRRARHGERRARHGEGRRSAPGQRRQRIAGVQAAALRTLPRIDHLVRKQAGQAGFVEALRRLGRELLHAEHVGMSPAYEIDERRVTGSAEPQVRGEYP